MRCVLWLLIIGTMILFMHGAKKSIYLHPSGESSSFGVDDVGEYSNDFNYILDKYERLVNLDSSEYKNLSGYYLQYSFSEMKQLFNL